MLSVLSSLVVRLLASSSPECFIIYRPDALDRLALAQERRKKSEEAERKRRESRGAMVREQEKEEAKQAKDDPFSSLPGDSKLGLQRMLEMARDDPLHYMDEDAKARVQKARRELRCDVCRVLLQETRLACCTRMLHTHAAAMSMWSLCEATPIACRVRPTARSAQAAVLGSPHQSPPPRPPRRCTTLRPSVLGGSAASTTS